jgi:hypothetical protein
MAAELLDLENMTKEEAFEEGFERGKFFGALKALDKMIGKFNDVIKDES